MSKIIVNKNENYSVIGNYHIMDKRLSLKAKGLLTVMLSLPDNWEYSISGLIAISKENRAAIRSALDELKDNGYVIIHKILPNGENNGRFSYEYYIYEKPQIEIQGVGFQHLEFQHLENQQQISIKKTNIKEINNKIDILKEKNTKKEKQTFITEFLDSIDNAELREAYSDFIDMRKEIKAPITTQRMLNVLKNKLNGITQDTQKQIELLNEAIFNKWKSVYPIKPKNATQGKIEHNYGSFDLDKFEEKLNRD